MNSRRAIVKAGQGLIIAFAASLAPNNTGAEDSLAPRQPGQRDGIATIIHRADVVGEVPTNHAGPTHLWPLYSTPEARMNYVEVTGRSALHFHPDAEHKLYVLEGKVAVTAGANRSIASAGDLIVIPKGVPHAYDVPAKGGRAMLLTFDAPPYDAGKTVSLEARDLTK